MISGQSLYCLADRFDSLPPTFWNPSWSVSFDYLDVPGMESSGQGIWRRHLVNNFANLPDDWKIHISSSVSVVIGGMGLGAIDVVAALTRGRGGIFSDHGEKLVYMPSGNEPNMVLMSRTNRLRQPAEPRTACPSPRRLPSESTAAFWAAASPEEALRVFTSITGIPDFFGH